MHAGKGRNYTPLDNETASHGKRLFARRGLGWGDFQKAFNGTVTQSVLWDFCAKAQSTTRFKTNLIQNTKLPEAKIESGLAASTKHLFKVFNIKMWAMPDLRQFTPRHPFARCSDVRWGD